MTLEDQYKVELTPDFIRVTHPLENDQMVRLSDVVKVIIRTTDEGPFLPDVWLVIIGNESYCRIPQGNKSYDEVFDHLSKWEGFDFEKYIESMSSTDNAVFSVWISETRN